MLCRVYPIVPLQLHCKPKWGSAFLPTFPVMAKGEEWTDFDWHGNTLACVTAPNGIKMTQLKTK